MSKIVPLNPNWKRMEQDQLALGAYMKSGEENGDTDWYCPESMPPKDGEPVYAKVEIVLKGWYLPDCKLSNWIFEDGQEPKEKILSWQKREDAKNYHDKSDECKPT